MLNAKAAIFKFIKFLVKDRTLKKLNHILNFFLTFNWFPNASHARAKGYIKRK